MKSRRLLLVLVLGMGLCLFWTASAAADEAPTLEGVTQALTEKGYDLDTVWTLIAGFLVMWMQAGFAAVEAGFTRAKNAVNIIMKNLLDFSFGTLAFWVVGFGLMFSIGNSFMGTSGWFLNESQVQVTETAEENGKEVEKTVEKSNFDPISWTNVPLGCKFFFQLVFAATAATIVSGAMAERTKFGSYMAYSLVITAIIYPISGHWIWGGGWLASVGDMFGTEGEGMWDFAGSTVVHSVGGWLALTGALVLGPRLGKYTRDGKPRAIPGHNIPLAALGVFILWLGWFGFNPGSTMGAARGDIAHIVCTTNLAAAAGVVSCVFTAKLVLDKWDSGMALNGALAGLVAITAPCAFVDFWAAVAIGLLAGVLCLFSILFFERIARVDDPVGAISVHGVCGAFGTLAVGIFAHPIVEGVGVYAADAGPAAGLLYGGYTQFVWQLVGVLAVLAWCLVTGFGLFLGIKYTMGLRVPREEEISGLDVVEHGNEAYFSFQLAEPAELTTTIPTEPRRALTPAAGPQKRYTLVVHGVSPDMVASSWSEMCQPLTNGTHPSFKDIYAHMTTMNGNRFVCCGGDPDKVRTGFETLFKDKLQASGLSVSVEDGL